MREERGGGAGAGERERGEAQTSPAAFPRRVYHKRLSISRIPPVKELVWEKRKGPVRDVGERRS